MNTTPTDLERVGEALRAGGMKVLVFEAWGPTCKARIEVELPDKQVVAWHGDEEKPALAFAVMGILDEAGQRWDIGSWLEWPEDWSGDEKPTYKDMFRGRCLRLFRGDGAWSGHRDATLTGSAVKALIEIHAAGLLPQGGG